MMSWDLNIGCKYEDVDGTVTLPEHSDREPHWIVGCADKVAPR